MGLCVSRAIRERDFDALGAMKIKVAMYNVEGDYYLLLSIFAGGNDQNEVNYSFSTAKQQLVVTQ